MCVLLITHIPNVTFTVDKNVLLKCIGKMSFTSQCGCKVIAFSLGQSNNARSWKQNIQTKFRLLTFNVHL